MTADVLLWIKVRAFYCAIWLKILAFVAERFLKEIARKAGLSATQTNISNFGYYPSHLQTRQKNINK